MSVEEAHHLYKEIQVLRTRCTVVNHENGKPGEMVLIRTGGYSKDSSLIFLPPMPEKQEPGVTCFWNGVCGRYSTGVGQVS